VGATPWRFKSSHPHSQVRRLRGPIVAQTRMTAYEKSGGQRRPPPGAYLDTNHIRGVRRCCLERTRRWRAEHPEHKFSRPHVAPSKLKCVECGVVFEVGRTGCCVRGVVKTIGMRGCIRWSTGRSGGVRMLAAVSGVARFRMPALRQELGDYGIQRCSERRA
jgi:hypothetical protein